MPILGSHWTPCGYSRGEGGFKTRLPLLAAIAATCLSVGTVAPLALAQAQSGSPPASPTLIERADQVLEEHQVALVVASLAAAGYLGVLGLRPRWLLKLPSSDIALPWAGLKVPLPLVRPLKYHNRVLDAWVEKHWQTAQAEFLRLDTVKRKTIHIPLPVGLDDTTVSELGPEHLAPTFKKKLALLLITGEGGAGKTSLACQIAHWGLERHLTKHRMLPVLIQTDLDDGTTLLEAVQGQLDTLTNQADPLPVELVEKLLHRQRILVIVDHLSEMGALTRKAIAPHQADFPAKALVITSRLKEQDRLGSLPKTTIRPLQIESNRLWPFMSAYLAAKGKQDLFDDDEYSTSCDRLRRMTADKSITALLACLYIDHMIREREGAGGILPDSVPRLMLSYLKQLNSSIEAPNKRDDLAVQRDAKAIAWACVKPTYRPNWIKKETAIAVLAQTDAATAQARLEYLENRLQFLKTSDSGDLTGVFLDPLAEYLAAAYLVDHHSQQADPTAVWQCFFEILDQKLAKANETPEIVRGFLLALRDCCLDDAQNEGIPPGLADQLARKAYLDPEELRQAQEKRRIRRLIFDLSEPDLKDRIRAAEELGTYGAAARAAELNLVGMLENCSQPLQARQAAAETLGKLAIGETALLTLMGNPNEETTVRRSAAEALGAMKVGQEQLLSILYDAAQPLILRQGAGRALRLIGGENGAAIPVLVVTLQLGQATTQVKTIKVWQEPLDYQLTLDLVDIPGGEFLMGSPPDEVGRDIYPSFYPDTVGKDVEAQHWVTVEPFAMGQFPVTQAQWRAVAALPRVNQDLAPDPASFKGYNRPVEQVSWHAAVEFCDRLSQHTGKPYRLPSEAEWEYACRVKITTPFHFGDTLSTDLANCNGNHIYGTGAKGEYRKATTAIGQFGVANAFGLFDLHGNVFEWCLDHWHPSYEGAPADGSAWVIDGNEGRRIVRGGAWYNDPRNCRSAYRYYYDPSSNYNHIGLRVCCSAPRALQRLTG